MAKRAGSADKASAGTGRSTTISGSIERSVAAALTHFLERTHWQQSRVISDALELYMGFSPVTIQRIRELEGSIGVRATRAAITSAVERAVDQLEWDLVAVETARELEGRFPKDMTERELVDLTNSAIAASRAERRKKSHGRRGAAGRGASA